MIGVLLWALTIGAGALVRELIRDANRRANR